MNKEKQYPTWELIALIVGFVGSANLVPDLVNLFFNFYPNIQEPLPREYKIKCIILYLIVLVILASRHLYRIHIQHLENTEDNDAKFKRVYRKLQILAFIRQFPLSLFNLIIFNYYKVISFDHFKRHGDWAERPDLLNLIGRFRIKGKTIELQYPKNLSSLLVRETIDGSDRFGEFKHIAWTKFQFKLLSITSWLGLIWTIAHLSYQFKLYSKLIIGLGISYGIGFVLHLLDIFSLRLNFESMNNEWKAWILFLLVFDLIASVGLFRKKIWGELTFLLIAVVQIFAYSRIESFFGKQDFLIYFHFTCLISYFFLKSIELWRSREEHQLAK